jgi:uncharacterized DUF497 family protein
MNIAWDWRKAVANRGKHGIRFSDAEAILFDPNAITREDPVVRDEQRFISVGTDALGRILVVVYAHRGDEIRLISARRATRKERTQYEEGIQL